MHRKGFTLNRMVQGFTLIELLVVIAIIGLLSTLAIFALGTARLKSRDARRVADLKSIQTALELYYSDLGGYPVTSSVQLGDATHACLDSTGFHVANGCVNAYLASIPKDPKGGYYSYTGVANNYKVLASLEGMVNSLSGQISVSPNSGAAADQIVLSLPFDKPGCYPSGSALGTLGEQVTVIRNSTSTYIDTNGVLQTCLANQLRVTPSGALIEPGATNLTTYSADFSSWTKIGVTVAQDGTLGPDGSSAWKITDDTTGATHRLIGAIATVASGTPFTRSWYVKAGSVPPSYVCSHNQGWTATVTFSTASWSVTGASAGASGNVLSLGNGWYRLSATINSGSTADYITLNFGTASGCGGYTGSGAYSLYATDAQLEAGSVATSYIPTGATTMPRNADQVSVANPLTAANTSWCIGGTYQPQLAWNVASPVRALWGMGADTTPNSAYRTNNGGTGYMQTYDGVPAQRTFNISSAVAADSSAHRILDCDGAGTPSSFLDGAVMSGSVTGGGSGLLGVKPATIDLGGRTGPGQPFGGTISNLLVCNTGTYGQGGCQ